MTNNVPENQARQGPLGRPVLVVLIAALLLAIAAWGVDRILMAWSSKDRRQTSKTAKHLRAPAQTRPRLIQFNLSLICQQPAD